MIIPFGRILHKNKMGKNEKNGKKGKNEKNGKKFGKNRIIVINRKNWIIGIYGRVSLKKSGKKWGKNENLTKIR